MAGRLLKCYGDCGKKYEKEQLTKVGSQNFCFSCAAKKEKERKDRDVLYKTIQTIFQIAYPTGQMLRQIKEYQDVRNYSYEGMTKTLCYLVKVKKQKPYKNGGLAFVPHFYENAIEYYDKLEERRKNAKDINEKNVRHIVIAPIKHDTSSYKKSKMIPMEANLLYDN